MPKLQTSDRLPRRALGAVTVLLLFFLTACGSTAADDGAGEGWSHVSGSGKTIKTDREVVPDPVCGTPMIVPRGRHHAERMTPELTTS